MTTAVSARDSRVRLPVMRSFVDGNWRSSSDGGEVEVLNPATEEMLGRIPECTTADVDAAVQAARRAFESGPWPAMSGAERGRLLWRLADLVERDRETLAALEAVDVGRPLGEPFEFEIPMVADVFRYYAGAADKITGSTFSLPAFAGNQRFSYTLRQPLGVVGAITPWNAPTMTASWKIAPALAVGNTVVLKPAELASLSMLHLAGLIAEAGFPPGVFNVVTGTGSGTGQALVDHAGIDKISFTGSPEVGRRIAAACGASLTKLTLELGGKSPQIVRADADLAAAAPVIAGSVFVNQGQTCAAGARILVHRSRMAEVVDILVEQARRVVVGDPFDPASTMGSLISRAQLDRVLGYVKSGVDEGADLLIGGDRIGKRGFFMQPTVFSGSPENTIAREEIFGPVATVMPFEDDDEALRLANDSVYGLTAVLWTNDASAVERYTRALHAGSVWVNAWGAPHPALPWSGRRTSGVGEELGTAGLMANTVEKTVSFVSLPTGGGQA